ncbi:MAG TPA: penicillin-insensitive murein endopeptidase [Methylococcaceae bacterium]|nr:penicillin-insensitive murein endopeptidase [Methylococcaceae bacterium]
MTTKAVLAPVFLALVTLPVLAHAADSICYGSSSKGRLEGGVQIPESGPNFSPYSSLGVGLGRTFVHSKVSTTTAAAYKALEAGAPGKLYMYGESGWREGGRIKPHRTHQNGLAVDFMVPVKDSAGKPVFLLTGITNKFGYAIEFDAQARHGDLSIDFEAIAEHLYALHQAARENGIGISRVIFEKAYLPKLYETRRGEFVKASIPFMQGEPWIRHDEHYHVDFAVACKPG